MVLEDWKETELEWKNGEEEAEGGKLIGDLGRLAWDKDLVVNSICLHKTR